MVKVSFVVPVKNGQKFISRTISSILNQTEKNIEVIVINDHSTDQTPEIVRELAAKDKRLILLNLEDKTGVAAGRNLGTSQAKGELILPTDADDPNFPKRAEISLRELKKNRADIFYGNLMRFYVDTGQRKLRHFQPHDEKLLKFINFIPHGASSFYKYVFEKIGGYDETIKIGEDYDFWLRTQELGFKFCSKNVPLAQYIMHQGQITNISNQEKIAERQKWNRIIREKHGIYEIDLDYVKKTATPEVIDFYVNKNFDIWFSKESIPIKSK